MQTKINIGASKKNIQSINVYYWDYAIKRQGKLYKFSVPQTCNKMYIFISNLTRS